MSCISCSVSRRFKKKKKKKKKKKEREERERERNEESKEVHIVLLLGEIAECRVVDGRAKEVNWERKKLYTHTRFKPSAISLNFSLVTNVYVWVFEVGVLRRKTCR
jgi:hypothetical protein